MIDDLLKSAKETIAERLTSPLLGSFLIAWCLWNYKFLVILFSAASVSQTFKLIETVAFPDAFSIISRGVAFPLISAIFYVFFYPYPARYVYAFTLQRQKEINQIKRQINEETPLTIEESRRIRVDYLQLERKSQESIDRLNEEVLRLKAALDQKQKEESDKTKIPPPALRSNNIDPSQLSLLRIIDENGGRATLSLIMKKSLESKVRTDFDIGELEKMGLIKRGYDPNLRQATIEFTHEGRRVFLNDGKLTA